MFSPDRFVGLPSLAIIHSASAYSQLVQSGARPFGALGFVDLGKASKVEAAIAPQEP